MTAFQLSMILMLLLTVKHFIVDFTAQPAWMYENKGTYGHHGGVLHAWVHGLASQLVFGGVTLYLALNKELSSATHLGPAFLFLLCVSEALAHYHIDWAKVNICKAKGWGPTTHEEYWWLLGFDQLLHALCYLAEVYLFVSFFS